MKVNCYKYLILVSSCFFFGNVLLSMGTETVTTGSELSPTQKLLLNIRTLPAKYAAQGNEDMALAILNRLPFAPNYQDELSNSALHYAAEKGFERLAEALLHKNIDLYLKNKNGETALEVAEANGHDTIMALILSKEQQKAVK